MREVCGRVDHVDATQVRQLATNLEHPVEEPGILDDGDLGLGVPGQVLDLLG